MGVTDRRNLQAICWSIENYHRASKELYCVEDYNISARYLVNRITLTPHYGHLSGSAPDHSSSGTAYPKRPVPSLGVDSRDGPVGSLDHRVFGACALVRCPSATTSRNSVWTIWSKKAPLSLPSIIPHVLKTREHVSIRHRLHERSRATRSCIGDCGSIRHPIRLGCPYCGMRFGLTGGCEAHRTTRRRAEP